MLDKLKSELEAAAFMLVDNASRKDIHARLIGCLVLVEQLRAGLPTASVSRQDAYHEEINKVQRRLRLWEKRQDQYNARILNAFLELYREGKESITEEDIFLHLGSPPEFSSNFAQMKIVADRNHGKIFDVNGQVVTIWPPVAAAVEGYEKHIFNKPEKYLSDPDIQTLSFEESGELTRLFSNTEIQERIHKCLQKFSLQELDAYCEKELSKQTFGIDFPLLVKVKNTFPLKTKKEAVKDENGHSRWTWKYSIEKEGFSFALCTQWYSRQDVYVKQWLDVHE